jgi:hypothetical protein
MRSKRALWRAGVVSVAGLAIAAGCSLVTSYDGFVPEGPPACRNRVPEPVPGARNGTGGVRIGTMSELRFLGRKDGGALGFDLDKRCTCPAPRGCSNTVGAGTCDPEGIDNAANKILGGLYPPEADKAGPLQDSIRYGKNGMLVQVKGWDGKNDDADVQVSVYNVAGLKNAADGGARFDGQDEILVDFNSLLVPAELGSNYRSLSAFVANGVLVASFSEFPLRLEVPNQVNPSAAPSAAAISLQAAYLIGKITPAEADGLRMPDAQLVGRIARDKIFEQISKIGRCRNDIAFPNIKQETCKALDVPLRPSQDRRDVPCDALSFAIGLTIEPAKLSGYVVVPEPGLGPCGVEPPVACP